MVDLRGERRAAEKAARELISGKVAFIGDVGEAAAVRIAAQAEVDAARDRARELVEEARREGERLVAAAKGKVSEADTGYAEAFHRAVAEGWTASMLTDLGHPAPARPSRRAASAVTASSSDRPGAAVQVQHQMPAGDSEQDAARDAGARWEVPTRAAG